MAPKVPITIKQLQVLVTSGEGPDVEFKRSTGELKEGLQTLCAFLNGSGGMLLFGVRSDGTSEGQQVSDQTLREIAQALDRFEPPVNIPVERLPVGRGREVLILRASGALREILLNAVMHRDYSYAGGHVAIVGFDDRIEVRSYGRLPAGITVDQLSGPHLSELRNPLIAEAFHPTGAVEVWGRGTNRVIAECRNYGVAAPTFEERQGFLVVTFRAQLAVEPPQVTPQVKELIAACKRPLTRVELQSELRLGDREHFRTAYLLPALAVGVIERTIPDRPRSRLQRYRLTSAGRKVLEQSRRVPPDKSRKAHKKRA